MPRRLAAAALGLVLPGAAATCTDGGHDVVAVVVTPSVSLAVGAGATVAFEAMPLNAAGEPLARSVTWRSASPGIATVDRSGTATAVAPGTTTLTAEVDGVLGVASLEVWVPSEPASYEPGVTYTGRGGYVEYLPGTLPLVVAVPHGGDLTPAEIADRSWGTLVTDTRTVETALALRDALAARAGAAPHVVISRLKRTKLDPNRELDEAAQGDPFAENAWREFHGYIEAAEAAVRARHGRGLFLDLHGHGHPVARVELGYLLTAGTLALADASLDAAGVADGSSIRALAASVPAPFSELLRGEGSLGGLLSSEGYRAVPGPEDPNPGGDEYFAGGYSTRRHGSRDPAATVDGVQLELPFPGVRDTDVARRAFAEALARAVETFMTSRYGFFVR